MLKEGERIDDLQLKGLRIIQDPSGFCFGVDAVLLSDFSRIKKNEKVVDLGTGTGVIPLLIYGRYEPKEIIGVEIQPKVAEMALRSMKLNNLQDRIRVLECDIKKCYESIGVNSVDVVVSNPPYKKGNTGLMSPEEAKAISRNEILIDLDGLIYTAARLLKDRGRLYMIHRPERLKDIILALDKHRFTPKRIRFVHPSSSKAPTMLLIEASKGGGEFLKIEESLYIYNEDGSYSDEINRIYGRCK